MQPSLRQLECIVAVADHLNFSRAAESIHVTQPALSAQVQQLETMLRLTLFERDRRRVLVTPAGEELVARARRVLAEVGDLVERARILREPFTGTLRLGVIPTVAPYVLPLAFPALRRAFPGLRVLLREGQTSTLVAEALDGRLDLLLLALEADLGGLETRPLYRDPFVLIAPRGTLPAGRKTVRTEELAELDILLLEDGHCLRDQALSVCRSGGARELGDFRASSLNTLVRMVSSGQGATLLPAMAVDHEVHRADGLEVRPFAGRGGQGGRGGTPARTIGLAWRPSSARAEELRAIGDVIADRRPPGVTDPG
jgi:LysR family hydrogen peroxide-inducible transcriptional activator